MFYPEAWSNIARKIERSFNLLSGEIKDDHEVALPTITKMNKYKKKKILSKFSTAKSNYLSKFEIIDLRHSGFHNSVYIATSL